MSTKFILIILLCVQVLYVNSCIKLLNGAWKPVSLEERTKNAGLVVTAKILFTSPIPKTIYFYSATFQVINVLKGWDLLKKLYKMNSTAVSKLEPNIVATAVGFGDDRHCFSSVEEGESYALFLGYKADKDSLVARYDDLFGAASRLYQRTEREILETLGWEEWSSWSKCTVNCGTGKQIRSRGCRETKQISKCHGPNNEKRQCNTFKCKDSFDVLTFILNQRKDHYSQWQPHDNEVFKNAINQPSPAKAPTHLLLANFPRESVLHIAFKGPVKDTQFLHSIYDANNRMEFGVKVSRYSFAFTYDKKVDMATKFRRVIPYTYNFSESIWYSIAILLYNDKISFKINCEEVHTAALDDDLVNDLDVYGQMYLGASNEEELEQSRVKVEIGSILISKDTTSLSKQCGMLLVKTDRESSETEGDGGSGMAGMLSGPDDSESGDVDEEYGSGEHSKDKECTCLNGGVCKLESNTCFCPYGWTGHTCETPICNNECKNGGNCTAPNKCTCRNSTSGIYCQFNECQLPCMNGGTCIGINKCLCKEGFKGPRCQHSSCSCENKGKCKSNGQCICTKEYKGEKCQYPKNCEDYAIKQIKFLKPAKKIILYEVKVPCKDKRTKDCVVSRSKSINTEIIDYREIYVCDEKVKKRVKIN